VIARNSSFRYKGQAVDVRKIGEDLGAKYLLEGSVRRSADTVRVTAQLVETGNGSQLWSKTYDRALTAQNVFTIQDEIAGAITSTLAAFHGALRQEDLSLAKRKAPRELNSYDCVLLGMEYDRIMSLETFRPTRDCLERATTVDPDYAALWSYLSLVYRSEYVFDYDPRPGSLDRALDAAQRAVRLAPDDASSHSALARAHFFRGELAEFKAETARANELSPMGSTALGAAGVLLCYAGEWDKGLALIEQGKLLDPHFPSWYHWGAFHDYYRKGRYQAALELSLTDNLPGSVQAQSLVVAAYGQLGRAEEAKPYVKRILELDAGFEAKARESWYKRFRYQPEYLEHLLDGMRKGGLRIPQKKD
jgi:tetratricopeptide (TPR) repeat protein